MPSSRARSSLAIDERGGAVVDTARVAGRHRAVRTERRLQLRERLRRRRRPWVLVDRHVADCHELVLETPCRLRGRPSLLRAQRERVLILARHAPALGDVLARLAHRLEREQLLEQGVREAPAQRRVPHRLVPARKRGVRLRHDQRRAAHRLDAARDDDVGVAGEHRVGRGDDGRQPGRAQPVQRDAGDRVGEAREQRAHPRDVAVVLTRLVRAAEVDVVDRPSVDSCPLDRGADRRPGEVVGPDTRERAAVPADRRAHGGEDHCAGHQRTKSMATGSGNAPSASPRRRSSVTAFRPSSP